MKTLDAPTFTKWLQRYRAAWETRDSRAAAQLFTDDAEYHWTPFDPPQRGPREIAAAWEGAVSKQKDVCFTFEVFAVSGATGMARWHTTLTAVPGGEHMELNGVLTAELDEQERCRVFREWWHLRNTP